MGIADRIAKVNNHDKQEAIDACCRLFGITLRDVHDVTVYPRTVSLVISYNEKWDTRIDYDPEAETLWYGTRNGTTLPVKSVRDLSTAVLIGCTHTKESA